MYPLYMLTLMWLTTCLEPSRAFKFLLCLLFVYFSMFTMTNQQLNSTKASVRSELRNASESNTVSYSWPCNNVGVDEKLKKLCEYGRELYNYLRSKVGGECNATFDDPSRVNHCVVKADQTTYTVSKCIRWTCAFGTEYKFPNIPKYIPHGLYPHGVVYYYGHYFVRVHDDDDPHNNVPLNAWLNKNHSEAFEREVECPLRYCLNATMVPMIFHIAQDAKCDQVDDCLSLCGTKDISFKYNSSMPVTCGIEKKNWASLGNTETTTKSKPVNFSTPTPLSAFCLVIVTILNFHWQEKIHV